MYFLCQINLGLETIKIINIKNFILLDRYTGLESSDVEMSAQEGNHLKLLMDKLHEKNRKIRKLITDNEVNEVYESGSSSGSGGQGNYLYSDSV